MQKSLQKDTAQASTSEAQHYTFASTPIINDSTSLFDIRYYTSQTWSD